jgi:hypothetical protein
LVMNQSIRVLAWRLESKQGKMNFNAKHHRNT